MVRSVFISMISICHYLAFQFSTYFYLKMMCTVHTQTWLELEEVVCQSLLIIGHWSKPLSDVMIDYENCRTMKKLLLTNENIKTCVFKWTHNAAIIYWWPFSPTLFAFVVCWKQGTVAMLNLKMIHSKKKLKWF